MGTDVGTARANLKWQSSDKHSARIGSLHNYDNHSEISEIMSFTIIYKHALSSFGPCWATSNHQISNRMQRRKRRELLLPCHALAYSLIVWWVLSSACKRWQTRSTLWFCTPTPHIICPYLPKVHQHCTSAKKVSLGSAQECEQSFPQQRYDNPKPQACHVMPGGGLSCHQCEQTRQSLEQDLRIRPHAPFRNKQATKITQQIIFKLIQMVLHWTILSIGWTGRTRWCNRQDWSESIPAETQELSKALPELNLADELTDVHNPANQLVGCPLKHLK